MRVQLTNLSGSQQVSTQLGILAPNQTATYDVDSYDQYRSELESLVRAGIVAVSILSSAPSTIEGDIITRPLTMYVSASGSDTNPGSQDKPFRSIQAAINTLSRKSIQSVVTISVGPGSFKAFSVDGTLIGFATVSNHITPYITAPRLNIVGSWSTPTLTSGTTSGTATGAVVNLAAEVTDAGQSWTVNELRGKYILIGSNYWPIISNTATVITIPTSNAQSGAYSIWDIGTNIDTETASVGSFGGTQTGRIAIQNISLAASTTFAISAMNLNLDGMASGTTAVSIRNASVLLENVSMVRSSSSVTINAISATQARLLNLVRSYVSFPSTLGNGVTSGLKHDSISVNNCYFRNGALGISTAPGSSVTTLLGTTFDTVASGVTSASGGIIALLAGNRFLSCTTAITVGSTTTSSSAQLTCSANTYFGSCGTILSASSGSQCALANTSGSSNTNGIVLTKGARCQIGNTATLGATTELSVDGTTGTLAALRAASPRVFPATANPYSTYVFE